MGLAAALVGCGFQDPMATEDELAGAVRASAAGSVVPALATRESIEEFEHISDHRLPPLLARLPTEVANGGFGMARAPLARQWHVRGHHRSRADGSQ
jgi:hypothetical protein